MYCPMCEETNDYGYQGLCIPCYNTTAEFRIPDCRFCGEPVVSGFDECAFCFEKHVAPLNRMPGEINPVVLMDAFPVPSR